MSVYYNENAPFPAQWLRNLIAAGHIPPGDVDERDIRDVKPYDLQHYTQCHFFAGIGIWAYALRRAGWPHDRPVWTGSCPCQPFSAAGGRGGFADERHLWPHFFHLIRARRPVVVFGEQVASKDGLAWLDLVSADLEGEGYAFGAVDLCAAGVGAPHIRQRLYFVAESQHGRCKEPKPRPDQAAPFERGSADGLADMPGDRRLKREPLAGRRDEGTGPQGEPRRVAERGEPSELAERASGRSFWCGRDWLPCIDGKSRPVEPGTFPLAHGAPARVGRLRAYGNAIVAPLAEEFIKAYLEAETRG